MIGQPALHNNIVYPTLRKFLQEGWVSKKSVPGERGQTRQQYALTAEGRRTLMERLNQFTDADAASEEAFRMRLGLLEYLKPEASELLFASREKYLQHREEGLESLQGKMDLGKFGGEIVRYIRKQIEMEQDWLRHLRRMARAASRS